MLKMHVSPPKINDRFSGWVFDNFLDELDPDHGRYWER
jgi:hypothetical protein